MDFILIKDFYNHNTFSVQKYTHLNGHFGKLPQVPNSFDQFPKSLVFIRQYGTVMG